MSAISGTQCLISGQMFAISGTMRGISGARFVISGTMFGISDTLLPSQRHFAVLQPPSVPFLEKVSKNGHSDCAQVEHLHVGPVAPRGSEGRSPPVEAIVSSLGGEGACRALPMAGWKSTIQQVWKTAPLAAGVQLPSLGQAETIGLCVSVFARVARKQNARSQPDCGRLKR